MSTFTTLSSMLGEEQTSSLLLSNFLFRVPLPRLGRRNENHHFDYEVVGTSGPRFPCQWSHPYGCVPPATRERWVELARHELGVADRQPVHKNLSFQTGQLLRIAG